MRLFEIDEYLEQLEKEIELSKIGHNLKCQK